MSSVELSRREFLGVAGRVAAASLAGGAALSCAGGGADRIVVPADRGGMTGLVVDAGGQAQPGLGTITLMFDSGLHTGSSAAVDATGKFAFPNLPPGDYQIRFDAPGKAKIPDGVLHPIRFTVDAGRTTSLRVTVEVGASDTDEIEIYIGDYFFQWQPGGIENGEAVARIGMLVCWYNVGKQIHTATGGPWGDSGDMQRTASFMWTADRAGVFGYRCKYHPNMIGTLRITA